MQAPAPLPPSNGYAPADYTFGQGVTAPAQQPTNPGGPVMHEMGYVESQPAYPYATGGVSPYSLPSHQHQHASINSSSVPIVSAKEAHESRQVDFLRWLRGGWSMYCENWKYFSGFQLIIFLFDFLLPLLFYVMTEPRGDFHTMHGGDNHYQEGTAVALEYRESPWQEAQHLSLISLLTWPLYLGHFFVGLAVLRAKVYGVGYNSLDDDSSHHDQGIIGIDAAGETDEARIRFHDFLSGYYLYFPLFALTFVHGLLLLMGFLCLILPGIYLAVVLAFTEILYIEYHHAYSTFDRYADEPQPFTFWQAFTVSVERVHPHFLRVAAFLLILAVVYYAGALTIFGSILTVPFTSLCLVVAFEDLFGLRQDKVKEHACVFAC